MEVIQGSDTVFDAFRIIQQLRLTIRITILTMSRRFPYLDNYATFQSQIKLIHTSILALLVIIQERPSRPMRRYLRVHERSWRRPPRSTTAALDEALNVTLQFTSYLNQSTQSIRVPNFRRIIWEPFREAMGTVVEIYSALNGNAFGGSPSMDNVQDDNVQDEMGMDNLQGATEEQINSLPVQTATDGGEEAECPICLHNIVAGQSIKTLQCSHSFHVCCINTWLRNNAICPMDRSEVFTPHS